MSENTLPKRILVLGEPSDYPPEFREISAACDFTIAAAPGTEVKVVKDRQGVAPRTPTLAELASVELVRPADVARILERVNDQRPTPRFEIGERITPGPNSTLGSLAGETGEVTDRWWCDDCHGWHYLVNFDAGQAHMLEPRMRPVEAEATDQHASPRDGEEATEKAQPIGPGLTAIGGRSGGKSEAMRQVIRENAATDEDAEQVLDALESNGRAFMIDGRFVAERPQPGAVEEVEAEPSLFDLFLSHLPGRRG